MDYHKPSMDASGSSTRRATIPGSANGQTWRSREGSPRPLDAGHGFQPWALARDVAPKGRTPGATGSARGAPRVPGRLASEDDVEPWPLDGRSLYATVKIAMEREVLRACQRGLPAVIVNPSVCVGEYDAHLFSGRLILAFAKHRMPFYLDKGFNTIYTGDVGLGHVRAAERGRIGERYLLTCPNIT